MLGHGFKTLSCTFVLGFSLINQQTTSLFGFLTSWKTSKKIFSFPNFFFLFFLLFFNPFIKSFCLRNPLFPLKKPLSKVDLRFFIFFLNFFNRSWFYGKDFLDFVFPNKISFFFLKKKPLSKVDLRFFFLTKTVKTKYNKRFLLDFFSQPNFSKRKKSKQKYGKRFLMFWIFFSNQNLW